MTANKDLFESATNIKEIFVFGHSINDIDLPYYKKIFHKNKNADWVVSYYGEREELKEKLLAIGVTSNKIQMVKLEDYSI